MVLHSDNQIVPKLDLLTIRRPAFELTNCTLLFHKFRETFYFRTRTNFRNTALERSIIVPK